MRQLCVHRDMKHLGSLESTQEVRVASRLRLEQLSCSPNFPRASHLDERTLTHEVESNESTKLSSNTLDHFPEHRTGFDHFFPFVAYKLT